MKKLFSILIIAAISVMALSTVALAVTVDTFKLDNGICAVVLQGQLGNGELSCDDLPSFIPEINCPEQDNNTPPENDGVTPPVQDNDTPSGDTDVIPPVQDNDAPSGDTDVIPPEQDNDAPSENLGISAYEKEVIRLVNEIRVANGLGELSADEELSRVARIKSQDMKDNNYFSHTSPTYGSPFEMMKNFGISYKTAGENIAKGYKTPQAVVDGWMNSPGHRANILNASYNRIGVGYVTEGNYWTQMFIGK